ncbi:MAG: sugar transferase [Phycisphaeraceae bacterium]
MLKRLFDIVVASAALLVLALPFLVIMAILKLTDEGQVWYFQPRVGYKGEHFNVYKFCTMRKGSEFTGTKDITLRNDPRVTAIGRFLRMTKINELPQIINVLKGDMSIVGPRPLVPAGFDGYSEQNKQALIQVKPGLTGIGSIVFRDEEAILSHSDKPPRQTYEEDILPYKGALERWYIANQSFWVDLKLILATVWAIAFPNSQRPLRWFKGLPDRSSVATPEPGTASTQRSSEKPAGDRPRVWMINHTAIPPTMSGGTRHYDFAVELTRRGYDVTIFASEFSYTERQHKKLRFGQLQCFEDYDGVGFRWINSVRYEGNNWKRIANMVSFSAGVGLAGLFRRKPDLIIGSSPHLFGALAALWLARLRRTRFFLEVRDLWPQTMIEGGDVREDSRTVKILRWMERLLYRNAEHIIVLAKGSKPYIAERGVSAERITFIPNGVHLGHFTTTESREAVRDRLDFGDKFVVMYAGAHGQLNALSTVVEAADRLRHREDILVVLVGDGPKKAELMALAQQKGLTNIRFESAVPKAEVPNLLAAADALVITLLNVRLFQYGVSPNKLFDYMASARPVICAVAGDMAELVQQAEAGLTVEPENPAALAEAVERLQADPAAQQRYSESGRRFIAEHYSRQTLADALEQRIAAALGRTPTPLAAETAETAEPAESRVVSR